MNPTPRIAVSLLLGLFCLPVLASNPACQYKASEIETQIQHAREHGNTHRVRGLERALANVKAHCSDTDLLREKREQIRDQEEDIQEVLAELQEKRADGRQDKVQKLERKLAREREELMQLQDELQELESLSGA